jgi:hypothetical protein
MPPPLAFHAGQGTRPDWGLARCDFSGHVKRPIKQQTTEDTMTNSPLDDPTLDEATELVNKGLGFGETLSEMAKILCEGDAAAGGIGLQLALLIYAGETGHAHFGSRRAAREHVLKTFDNVLQILEAAEQQTAGLETDDHDQK